MAIEIPVEYLDYAVWLVRAGGLQESILNGENQNLLRLGDRLRIDITVMPQRMGSEAPRFISRLFEALDDEGIVAWPADEMQRTGAGAVTVDGAVSSNASVLPVKGATPGFVFREGLFFHILSGGRRYVHWVRGGDYAVPGNGRVNLLIGPRLRVSLANNDSLEIETPQIQGDVIGERHGWAQASGNHTKPISFSILEGK